MEANTNKKDILAVEALKEKLYNDINDSGLSVVPIYYIMKDLMNEIIVIYNSELKKIDEESKKKDASIETVEGEVE